MVLCTIDFSFTRIKLVELEKEKVMKKINNSARYVFESNKATIELAYQYFSWWSVAEEIAQCFNGLVEESQIHELKKMLKVEFTRIKNDTTWENYPFKCSVALIDGKFVFTRG